MAFTAAAEATVVTPKVVKPQVVKPHVTTPAPAPSPAPAAAPAPSEPQASAIPSPSSPAELPPPGQGPPNPTHYRGPVGYTCRNPSLCEQRHEEEEDAERSHLWFKENDLRVWGMMIQGVPYAVAVATQASIYDLWPLPSVGGAASAIRDQIAGGVRLLQELLLKLKKN